MRNVRDRLIGDCEVCFASACCRQGEFRSGFRQVEATKIVYSQVDVGTEHSRHGYIVSSVSSSQLGRPLYTSRAYQGTINRLHG